MLGAPGGAAWRLLELQNEEWLYVYFVKLVSPSLLLIISRGPNM